MRGESERSYERQSERAMRVVYEEGGLAMRVVYGRGRMDYESRV